MSKYFYFSFMAMGVILPYSQFVPWSLSGGAVGDIFRLAFSNQISAGITLDAFVAALFLVALMFFDRTRLSVKRAWIPLVGVFLFGIAFAYPCYFYLRDRTGEL